MGGRVLSDRPDLLRAWVGHDVPVLAVRIVDRSVRVDAVHVQTVYPDGSYVSRMYRLPETIYGLERDKYILSAGFTVALNGLSKNDVYREIVMDPLPHAVGPIDIESDPSADIWISVVDEMGWESNVLPLRLGSEVPRQSGQ